MAIYANADRNIILQKAFGDRRLLWPFAPTDSINIATPAANSMVLSKMVFCPQIGSSGLSMRGVSMRGNWRENPLPRSCTIHLSACYTLLDECHSNGRQFFRRIDFMLISFLVNYICTRNIFGSIWRAGTAAARIDGSSNGEDYNTRIERT